MVDINNTVQVKFITDKEKRAAFEAYKAENDLTLYEKAEFECFGKIPEFEDYYGDLYLKIINETDLHILQLMRMTRPEKNRLLFDFGKSLEEMAGYSLKNPSKLMAYIRDLSDDYINGKLLMYCVDFDGYIELDE